MASTKGIRVFGLRLVILHLLLTHVASAKDELSLQMFSSNSSTVDFTCRYEGNKNNLFFKVYRGSDPCIFYKSTCQYYPQKDCKFQCDETRVANGVSFLVKLNRSCHEQVNIRCSVRTLTGRQGLELDKFQVLSAQSDPPEILINDEELVVGLKPVQIGCRVTNRCHRTMLEMAGVHMTPLRMSHTQEEGRFTTTAETSALFNKPGNYTITCKEAGKDNFFSSFRIIEIQNPAGAPQEPACRDRFPLQLAPYLGVFVLLLCAMVFFISMCQEKLKFSKVVPRAHAWKLPLHNDTHGRPLASKAQKRTGSASEETDLLSQSQGSIGMEREGDTKLQDY